MQKSKIKKRNKPTHEEVAAFKQDIIEVCQRHGLYIEPNFIYDTPELVIRRVAYTGDTYYIESACYDN